jgi:uncharacterized protein YyaL (SSP411 family)
MDQTSYSDSRIIELVNSSFVPVRVDVDERPDISRRYNQGGYPSLAILDHDGRLISGRIYTPPDVLLPFLENMSQGYLSTIQPGASSAGTASVAHQDPRTRSEDSPLTLVMDTLQDLYDPEYGGFGSEPKQPPWETLGLLLARYSHTGDLNLLKMVTTTLDGMLVGLYDHKDQGFFRYSVSRDWRVPHFEKMSLTNAGLAMAYFEAYQVTGLKPYLDAARGAVDFLLQTLYDPGEGLFYASQDAGEEYYRLPWKDRTPDRAPSIDTAFYTDWNAAAAGALIKAHDVMGGGLYIGAAMRTLDRLWDDCWTPGMGLRHIAGAAVNQQRYLVDQVQAARAFLDLYQSTGQIVWLNRTLEVVRCVRARFLEPGGGFRDLYEAPGSSGPAASPEFRLLENSWLAEVLVRLSQLTDWSPEFEDVQDTLDTFRVVAPGGSYVGPSSDPKYPEMPRSARMEDDEERLFLPAGSAWGRAWDMLESGPVHMVLVGDPAKEATQELLRSASTVYAPHKVVEQLSPGHHDDRISDLGFPTGGDPALYVCMNGICLAPMTDPREVGQLGVTRPWASAGRFVEFREL